MGGNNCPKVVPRFSAESSSGGQERCLALGISCSPNPACTDLCRGRSEMAYRDRRALYQAANGTITTAEKGANTGAMPRSPNSIVLILMTYKNTYFIQTLSVVVLLSLAGCASHARYPAVPVALQVKATVVGFPDEMRYFPRDPGDIKLMATKFLNSWEREKAVRNATGQSGPLPPAAYLAVSGGGDNGAYGAGFLNGWTKTTDGPRPGHGRNSNSSPASAPAR
jgi:hypothetical protein